MGEVEDLRRRMTAQGQELARLQAENDQLRSQAMVNKAEKQQWVMEKAMQANIIQNSLAAKDAEVRAISEELMALKEKHGEH